MVASALENGFDPAYVYLNGVFYVKGRSTPFKRRGFSRLWNNGYVAGLRKLLYTYFINLGQKLGGDPILIWPKILPWVSFSFAQGLIRIRAIAYIRRSPNAGRTCQFSIGEGKLLVTPVQVPVS